MADPDLRRVDLRLKTDLAAMALTGDFHDIALNLDCFDLRDRVVLAVC
jgi:hypothetical protein